MPSTNQRSGATFAATAQAMRAWNTLSGVLARLLPLARTLVTIVRVFAWSGVVATALVIVGILLVAIPTSVGGIVVLLLVATVLLLPAGVLLAFHGALREVLALPDWLRTSPDLARAHGAELAELVAEAKGPTRASARGGLLRDLARAGKLLLRTHGDLPDYGTMLRVISPPFLIAVGLSVVAVTFEWVLAPVALFVGIVARVIG